jgi:antitoxin HicB
MHHEQTSVCTIRGVWKEMKYLNYRILLRREPEGGYTVTVPMLPGCVTYGETIDEAIAMAREAIGLYIEDLREKGEDIPTEEGLLEYTLTVEAHA